MSAILERFARVCRDAPNRPLIHLPISRTQWTASQLWTRHVLVRDRLVSLGVQPDQLLISAVGNNAEYLSLLLACRAIGAAVMPLDADSTPDEIFELAALFHAVAVVWPSPAATDALSAAAGSSIVLRHDPDPGEYKTVAVLKLTSGSTGVAKATLTSESHLIADAQSIVVAMSIEPNDVQIAAIPLAHSYAIGNLVMPLFLQGTAFVLRESFAPQQLPSDAREFGVGVFPGVPFMFQYFNEHPPPGGWPSTLRRLISAGARLSPAEAHAFHERFGLKIHSFYGTSETGGISYDDAHALDDRPAAGRALPGVTVTLRPDQGTPPPGGRVFVRSAAVSAGYAGNAAGQGFEDGGFLTEDHGEFDANGRLLLTGRVSSFVNVAGRKVQPQEIEQVLRSMPGVADVRVLAAPDPQRGQQIAACLVTRTKMTTIDIRRYCAGRLAPYKIPRAVVFVDAIPVTARGKTDRRALDELVRAHLADCK
jgi:acyl-CoA synthetase (AMP-forming)/AMP-acid ligase II